LRFLQIFSGGVQGLSDQIWSIWIGAKEKLLLPHLDELLLQVKDLAQHSLLSSHECLYHRPGW
jgi:hypothetical protein